MGSEEAITDSGAVRAAGEARREPRWPVVLWLVCGGLILLFRGLPPLLAWLGPGVQLDPFGLPATDWTAYAAALAFLASAYCAWRGRFRPWMLAPLLIVALGIRAVDVLAPAESGQQGDCPDYRRYFWDGALVAHGINPFVYTAEDVIYTADPARSAQRRRGYPDYAPRQGYEPIAVADRRVMQLYQGEGRYTVDHINHPWSRSFYPPFIQLCFAAAYRIEPFSLRGWQVVLGAFDVLGAVLVFALLRRLKLGALLASVALWNPMFPAEGYARGHMEVVLAPLILLFLWCMLRRRYSGAAMALVLAAGVKLWPVLLVFFLIGRWRRGRAAVLEALGVFAIGLTVLVVIPTLYAMGPRSGLGEYGNLAEAMPGAYTLLKLTGESLRPLHGLLSAGQIARGLSTLMILAYAAFHGLRRRPEGRQLCFRVTMVCMLLLLLGPNTWPWYYMVVIPLAALTPRPSLLAWTLLLPLGMPGQLAGLKDWQQAVFYILAIHLPVWGLLIGESLHFRRRAGPSAPGAACG